jgi:8-oxo-dGTP pyrophosphatase MutT (NUDIX family)
MDLSASIQDCLSGLRLRQLTAGYKREAAVLIPIFEREGEPYFLLTRRTEEVETHKGQISFPGGMRHDGERLHQTALRETFEEIGIAENHIKILGQFHDYLSSTDYRVSPFAGYVERPFQTMAEPQEVAEILEVPFKIFFNPRRLRIEKMLSRGNLIDVYYYSWGHHEIWGLTARIIRDFLEELHRYHPLV